MTDTDSLVLEIRVKDFYEDIKDDIPLLFDTSNYPKKSPSLHRTEQKGHRQIQRLDWWKTDD